MSEKDDRANPRRNVEDERLLGERTLGFTTACEVDGVYGILVISEMLMDGDSKAQHGLAFLLVMSGAVISIWMYKKYLHRLAFALSSLVHFQCCMEGSASRLKWFKTA